MIVLNYLSKYRSATSSTADSISFFIAKVVCKLVQTYKNRKFYGLSTTKPPKSTY